MDLENHRCICGDNRGTDCDYCAGLYREGRKRIIDTTPSKNPIIDKKTTVDKTFNVLTNSTSPKEPLFDKSRWKSFDGRILELKSAIEKLDINSLPETIEYLKTRTYALNKRILSLENKVGSKQRNHFNRIKVDSMLLIKKFNLKFENFQVNRVVPKRLTNKQIIQVGQNKTTTMKDAFGELFNFLKTKLDK
jgi:hypothetical protein